MYTRVCVCTHTHTHTHPSCIHQQPQLTMCVMNHSDPQATSIQMTLFQIHNPSSAADPLKPTSTGQFPITCTVEGTSFLGLSRWHSGKESACQCRSRRVHGLDPWIGKIPWRRKWQPTPVFLPGESHGQRSLAGYSPWGCKESDMSKRLSTHAPVCFLTI